jgi:hypothetical protein
MLVISQHQLQYQYHWHAVPPDDPRVTGVPDSAELNRHEGYEVLAFLNRICQKLLQAQKAETLIRNNLPGDVRSHGKVLDWLQRNWSLFP